MKWLGAGMLMLAWLSTSAQAFTCADVRAVPSGMWLELVWRALRSYEGIVSGGEVNRLIDWFGGERLPAVDLAHVDLTGCKQRPEQHGGGVC